MQNIVDLHGSDRGALQRRHQHAAQRVAEREAETTLERLGDEGRAASVLAWALGLGFGLRFGFAVAALAAVILLPSKRLRGLLRVTIAKHLFQHRYDYRAEWLRFTRTLSTKGPDLGERVGTDRGIFGGVEPRHAVGR